VLVVLEETKPVSLDVTLVICDMTSWISWPRKSLIGRKWAQNKSFSSGRLSILLHILEVELTDVGAHRCFFWTLDNAKPRLDRNLINAEGPKRSGDAVSCI